MPTPILATDIDGTLLPLAGNDQNQRSLGEIKRLLEGKFLDALLVTGRDIGSTLKVIEDADLPRTQFLICAMGTEIYRLADASALRYEQVADYEQHLESLAPGFSAPQRRQLLGGIEGLELRPAEKQGRFKLSFFTPLDRRAQTVSEIKNRLDEAGANFHCVDSINPHWDRGLIDIVPPEISKAHAIDWWLEHEGLRRENLIFAGDGGNDLDAFVAGYKTILVGNTDPDVALKAFDFHDRSGSLRLHYLADQPATCGVLQGLAWWEVADLKPSSDPSERLGATPVSCSKTFFNVWAPTKRKLSVQVDRVGEAVCFPLTKQDDGYFCATINDVCESDAYRLLVNERHARPDPVSKFQPRGVHEASRIVNPHKYPWQDAEYVGVARRDLVIYELHVGTFTKAGTFRAAIDRIPELVSLGITAVELMPLAQCSGRHNWGYDGVNLFAPSNTYGSPDDLRKLVDAFHRFGVAVIVDVVYNHLGPEGNYLADIGPFFSKTHGTPWGPAFDFDDKHREPVRRFINENVRHWLAEYHVDGLRLDAVHFMFDDSAWEQHVLREVASTVEALRQQVAYPLHLIAEANIFDQRLLSDSATASFDAMWSDDIMHSVYSLLRPDLNLAHREYNGADDLAEALAFGYIYTGPDVTRVESPRADQHLDYLESLVVATQTHDCVGNHPHGSRLQHLASPEAQQAAVALTMLYPSIPMIFMGEESAADSPFMFFVDFENPTLRRAVDRGRRNEYPQHQWQGATEPSDYMAFHRSKCYESGDASMLQWYRELIALRKQAVASGVLSAANFRARSEPSSNLFGFEYEQADGEKLIVQVRLARQFAHAGEESSAGPVDLPIEGSPVLQLGIVDGMWSDIAVSISRVASA